MIRVALLPGSRALALPAGGSVGAGVTSITTPSATEMSINQESGHSIINWNSFGIGKNETVNIVQPTSDATLLNRVLGNSPSEIFGRLTANGRVFLVNQNGILFGPTASVNVGGLVASTLAISDQDFLSGKYLFSRSGSTAAVVNQGSLHGGFIALLGGSVKQSGSLVTTKGAAVMASGEGVTLDIDPFGMIAIRVDPATYNAQIENSGIIEAEEGTVVMSAPARDALVATVVNNSGTVRAAVMSTHDGEITLEGKTVINTGTLSAATIKATTKNLLDAGSWNAEGGRIEINATGSLVQTAASQMSTDGTEGGELQLTARESIALSGTLTANGTTGRGGRIAITAPQTLLAGAQLQADGRSGGGEILIGGGDGLPAHALTTMMTSPSTLQANALDSGNGGRVVLFSEKSTAFAGTIEAKGGATSGNGGHIELSSEDRLTWTGAVVTTAPNGLAGDILFTARNITVDASAGVPFSLTPLGNLNPIAGETAGGLKILELSNGNILVGSPHDDFVATNSGTLCLYRPDGTLLSMLSGLCANDMVGNNITPLSNSSNAVTATPYWSSDGVAGAGAVTWINGKSGITGVVTAANSLVGALAQDGVGSSVTALTNGNYVVVSPLWDNGATANTGAVTWGNGAGGTIGTISPTNSLIGSKANDQVGNVIALTNGNYVIASPLWDNGSTSNAGAVTWGNGAGGTLGTISSANSLVGSRAGDQVGNVTALGNGNYVVASPLWNNGSITNAGAVTWGNGAGGTVGIITPTNSLVGSTKEDQAGVVTALSNGNYVVATPLWDNGTMTNVGAVTWCNGLGGTVGVISPANSLTGSRTGDAVGNVTALNNGNYVVASPLWDSESTSDVGAVTWASGHGGTIGAISPANSLVGSSTSDAVGSAVTALSNGNYVVSSKQWDNGAATDAGAVTWGSGIGGSVGIVSPANSLVGSSTSDNVGSAVTALSNGNYVVSSKQWDNAAATDAGAVTWGDGSGGTVGVVSPSNSLIGTKSNDQVGNVTALGNGNYVVASPLWDSGKTSNAGSVTWGNGVGGTVGEINAQNSLVGTKTGDQVGSVTALENGNYVVASPLWNNGSITNAGAVTWGDGAGGTVGELNPLSTLAGSEKEDQLASGGIIPLTVGAMHGAFLFISPGWSNKNSRVALFTPLPLQPERPGRENSFTPAQLTLLLNRGEGVQLKASNDITINSSIVAINPAGNAGSLAMDAGRTILLSGSVTTSNGNLTLRANTTQPSTLMDLHRESGAALITMAEGSAINAGKGKVEIELQDGAGNTERESGDITLRDITAATISALNSGETKGSGITLASGRLATTATSSSSIVLAGKEFNNKAGVALTTAGTARWLIYSGSPDATQKGGLTSAFRHYNATLTLYPPELVKEAGNGFIYASPADKLSVTPILASGKASSSSGTTPSASYGYTLSGFSDNEDSAENIGLTGTMMLSGVPTASSKTGSYKITYAGGLSSSAGFTFTAGSKLTYTVTKATGSSSSSTSQTSGSSAILQKKVTVSSNEHFSSGIFGNHQNLNGFGETTPMLLQSTSQDFSSQHFAPDVAESAIGEASPIPSGLSSTEPSTGAAVRDKGVVAMQPIIIQKAAEEFFILPVPLSWFSPGHPDALSLELRSVNGSPIPEWMRFDAERKVIIGTPPQEAKGEYRVELVAKDPFGGETRTIVVVKVS